jgi:hypothetical protein
MGFLSAMDLKRSIDEECRSNDSGKWLADYLYVVAQPACQSTVVHPATGQPKVRDTGHDGWVLANFAELEVAKSAALQVAHVAVIRMYTGPFYRPWNSALRSLADLEHNPQADSQILEWATCISVLYDAILRLSATTKKQTVLRGVNESSMELPPEFLDVQANSDGFAGGVEMAFMSTTTERATAYEFSGGHDTAGTIFEMTFTAASRGASVQPFSQYPEEAELLFPPFTFLSYRSHNQLTLLKRVVQVDATVSTARPDLEGMDLSSATGTPPMVQYMNSSSAKILELEQAIQALQQDFLDGDDKAVAAQVNSTIIAGEDSKDKDSFSQAVVSGKQMILQGNFADAHVSLSKVLQTEGAEPKNSLKAKFLNAVALYMLGKAEAKRSSFPSAIEHFSNAMASLPISNEYSKHWRKLKSLHANWYAKTVHVH